MKKIIAFVLWMALVLPVAVAAEEPVQAGTPTIPALSRGLDGQSSQAGIVDAGNQKCPVMGEPVSGKDFVVYDGKRYGLCCPACEKIFLSDPIRYAGEANIEVVSTTIPSVAPAVSASEEMERDMEQGDF